jgi:chaperonin GroES
MAKAKKRSNASHGASTPVLPLNDRVLIKPLSPEEMGTTTASGIIIPDSAQEKPEQGTVVAIGPGKWNEDGDARVPVSVAVGDRVIFSKYGYDTVKVSGVEYYVVQESNILAVIKK